MSFDQLLELEAAVVAAEAEYNRANNAGDVAGMERAGGVFWAATQQLDKAVAATTPAVRERWAQRQAEIDAAHGGPFFLGGS